MQERQTAANNKAWNTKAYEAWVTHFGPPEVQAESLKLNSRHKLRRWIKYIGDPNGKRIINLLGSTGSKAIPLKTASSDFLPEDDRKDLPKVLLRKWTMGEILSTLADKNMYLRKLEEEPHHINSGIPAFYTIIADKTAVNLTPLTP